MSSRIFDFFNSRRRPQERVHDAVADVEPDVVSEGPAGLGSGRGREEESHQTRHVPGSSFEGGYFLWFL